LKGRKNPQGAPHATLETGACATRKEDIQTTSAYKERNQISAKEERTKRKKNTYALRLPCTSKGQRKECLRGAERGETLVCTCRQGKEFGKKETNEGKERSNVEDNLPMILMLGLRAGKRKAAVFRPETISTRPPQTCHPVLGRQNQWGGK